MFEELTDNNLTQDYDRYAAQYNKIMNELKSVCTTDDKSKLKRLQKRSRILHNIMSDLMKLRTLLSDEKNKDV